MSSSLAPSLKLGIQHDSCSGSRYSRKAWSDGEDSGHHSSNTTDILGENWTIGFVLLVLLSVTYDSSFNRQSTFESALFDGIVS